ncbi:MAG TPA: rhodanese-like domain-containing protein [Candidatus Sulfotelmatobacter sp.]|nr:rhodanese-like domain-containing protein [Candidatus Sulfotelmatobacter sp.]
MRHLMMTLIGFLLLGGTALAWGYQYLEPADMKQWLETGKELVIVDIQPAQDFAGRHFKGAIETNAFPTESEAERQRLAKAVAAYRAKPTDVVVVCPRGGGGAKRTSDYLKENGVPEKNLFILAGGMDKWPYGRLVQKTK